MHDGECERALVDNGFHEGELLGVSGRGRVRLELTRSIPRMRRDRQVPLSGKVLSRSYDFVLTPRLSVSRQEILDGLFICEVDDKSV